MSDTRLRNAHGAAHSLGHHDRLPLHTISVFDYMLDMLGGEL